MKLKKLWEVRKIKDKINLHNWIVILNHIQEFSSVPMKENISIYLSNLWNTFQDYGRHGLLISSLWPSGDDGTPLKHK